MKTANQIQKLQNDIAFCIDELNLDDEQIGELLRTCERLGNISVEYFCEEFIFEADNIDELADNEYLNIAEFNALYWE
jgi:hypothetical protein